MDALHTRAESEGASIARRRQEKAKCLYYRRAREGIPQGTKYAVVTGSRLVLS